MAHQLTVSHFLVAGDFFVVLYNIPGVELWHEILVIFLAPGGVDRVSIVTPDGDAYDKSLSVGADVRAWERLPNGA